MDFETIIGLEVHAQLLTKSKMFCRCSAGYADTAPNTHVCPVCMGMPGVLPTINQQAVEYTIMTALALGCTISEYTKFDRKNYPYPDLMKGYQISQFDTPFGERGFLNVEVDGKTRKIDITRVHLEEDTAKLIHRTLPNGETCSLVDINRAGVPLMEIVGEPDLRSPEEARQYLMKLRTILQYLGVSTGNMEEGSFRCDANISIRPLESEETLAKAEVKNMNSFRAVFRALEYEAKRQRKAVTEGKKLPQETRGWVDASGTTVSQRSKEYAHDYRYFPEPDLPPMLISKERASEIRAKLPELPEARQDRFMSEYGLPQYDADLLTSSKDMADYFEACLTESPPNLSPEKSAKPVANWILGELSRMLNVSSTKINESKIKPAAIMELLQMIDKGSLSGTSAKIVFEEMFSTGTSATIIVQQKGLGQISDSDKIKETVSQIITDNPQAVADYRSGKPQAIKFLLGQVMKTTRGRANPNLVNELIVEELKEG
ncbi:Asp-tRNA(Asn)/Glu-tRNA(Gln) amidotransferase subunit GatB [Chloroflexota bacterium]